MNRGWMIAGLVVIVAMCLVPPWHVEGENRYGDVTAEMLGVEETPEELEASKILYRPVGAGAPDRIDQTKEVERYEFATTRLLLQIVVVKVLFGGLPLLIGQAG